MDESHTDIGLYPPRPDEIEELTTDLTLEPGAMPDYHDLIESICGATDDSQPVEQYNGTLGVTQQFAAAHQAKVGQIQWDDDLANHYTNPGNVNNVRWCTGAMISNNLFLTAGHCFDSNPSGWQVPRVNGTSNPISPGEIASRMHINFNYQVDPNGDLRDEVEFRVEELIEHRTGGLDVAVLRLAGNPGATFGIGEVAPGDASVGNMMAIIGHPAGVPKRIEAGPVTQLDGDRIRYNDVDTLGGNSGSAIWQSPSGRIIGVHTNGGCNTAGTGSNSGMRIARVIEESSTIQSLAEAPLPVPAGIHTVRQQSSGRFVDAHESSGNDFSVVTRTAQNNDTQRWRFTPVGAVFAVQQVSSNRFMDAHESSGNDFSIVTRGDQDNDTQRWATLPVFGELSTYTLQQLSSGRFMDAHEHSGADFSVVTRTFQNNATQRWLLAPRPDGAFTVVQKSSGRFLDAHESSTNDFSVVTRTAQNNATQRWRFTPVAGVYTIQQVSSDRYIDAYEISANDFSVVTRTTQNNDTQRWIVTNLGGGTYTIQQLSNARYLDAHEHSGADFSVVTRPAQGNATQRWIIE